MFSAIVSHTLAGVLLGASSSPLVDIFVDINDANCSVGTGGPADPVCSIGAAIAMAAPGDVIRIAPGTYVENVTIGIDLDLIGTSGANVTTIDGGAAAGSSVITIPAAVTVTIEGLTVANGTGVEGGAIDLDGNLTLRNSTITGSTSSGYYGGGAISGAYSGGTLVIENSTILNNSGNYGGGIHHRDGTLTISGSTISGNTGFYYGGGVYALNCLVNISDSTFDGNMLTAGWGGGAEFQDSTVVMTGSTFSGNSAAYGGGAFEALGSIMTDVRNCTFSGNTAGDYGGAINFFGGAANSSLANVTITSNTASYYGAGLNNTTTGLGLAQEHHRRRQPRQRHVSRRTGHVRTIRFDEQQPHRNRCERYHRRRQRRPGRGRGSPR